MRMAVRFATVAAVVTVGLSAIGAVAASVDSPASELSPAARSRSADLPGVRLHYVIMGRGRPAVLLHGWPETSFAWRKVAPRLAAAGYQVIMPDLRGLGGSSRPASGYDRLTMAEDIRRLVRDELHLGPVLLVGHDWGGSVAAAWAGAHPEDVRKLVVIEAQPRGPWTGPEPWFYALHREPGLAEALTAGRERTYLDYFYHNFTAHPGVITPAEIATYLRTYGSPAGMRPGFELVRALPRDVAANTQAARNPSPVPVLAIGGAKGMGDAVATNLKPLFTTVNGVVLPDTGHFVPEETPEELARLVLDFDAGRRP